MKLGGGGAPVLLPVIADCYCLNIHVLSNKYPFVIRNLGEDNLLIFEATAFKCTAGSYSSLSTCQYEILLHSVVIKLSDLSDMYTYLTYGPYMNVN